MKKTLLTSLFALALTLVFSAKAQAQLEPHDLKMKLHGVSVSEIYPNPAEQMAFFDYRVPAGTREAKMEIFNLIGEVVWLQKLHQEAGTAAVSLNKFKRGVYFYRLHVDNDKTPIKKLVVR